MPDFDDTTACAPAQEPAPPADNHFVGVTIDTCAAIVDKRNAFLANFDGFGEARLELGLVAAQIRALKGHLS